MTDQPPGSPPPPPGWGQTPASGMPPPPPAGAYQPYGQGFPPAAGNPFDSRGTTILVLGILSLVICGLLGPVAWVMGNNLKREAAAAGFAEPGNSKAGRICGTIASVLMIAGIALLVILLIAGAFAGTTTSY